MKKFFREYLIIQMQYIAIGFFAFIPWSLLYAIPKARGYDSPIFLIGALAGGFIQAQFVWNWSGKRLNEKFKKEKSSNI